jgi:hypothetical protein
MNDKDYINVYWAPSPYVTEETSWTYLYSEPVSLLAELNKNRNKENKNTKNIFSCPSYVDAMKNVYILKSAIDDTINIPEELFGSELNHYPFVFDAGSKLIAQVNRPLSFNNHINIGYNLGWLMFADEPLEARFTAPYFPTISPANGVILSAGQMDIGKWYRDYTIDYHVPLGVKELIIKDNQPLAYIEFKTDKKIVFKRYQLTPTLRSIATELSSSGARYGFLKSLAHRYTKASEALIPQQVLTEIKKNLID